MYLLLSLVFADWPCFCLIVDLIVDLAIGGVESICGEIGIDFSKSSLCKLVINPQKYCTANIGS